MSIAGDWAVGQVLVMDRGNANLHVEAFMHVIRVEHWNKYSVGTFS